MTQTKIESRAQFDELLTKSNYNDFAMVLGGGLFSRLEVGRNEDSSYYVFHSIDGHDSNYTEKEMWDANNDQHNIAKAFENGNLYHLNYE